MFNYLIFGTADRNPDLQEQTYCSKDAFEFPSILPEFSNITVYSYIYVTCTMLYRFTIFCKFATMFTLFCHQIYRTDFIRGLFYHIQRDSVGDCNDSI